MKLNEILSESLNLSYPWKWEKCDSVFSDCSAIFNIPNTRIDYHVDFDSRDDVLSWIYEVDKSIDLSFYWTHRSIGLKHYELSSEDEDNDNMLQNHSAFRIFATILEICQDFLKRYGDKIDSITLKPFNERTLPLYLKLIASLNNDDSWYVKEDRAGYISIIRKSKSE